METLVLGFYSSLLALALNLIFLFSFYAAHHGGDHAAGPAQTLAAAAPVPAVNSGSVASLGVKRGDLPLSVIYETRSEAIALADDGQELSSRTDNPPQLAMTMIDQTQPSLEEPAEAPVVEMPAGALPEGIPAMLRASTSAKPGVEIGNFNSVSMQGGADECMAIGQSLVASAKGGQLDVMVTSSQITIAKICANNGAIFLTCRGGQITISPRHSRPDSRCEKSDA